MFILFLELLELFALGWFLLAFGKYIFRKFGRSDTPKKENVIDLNKKR